MAKNSKDRSNSIDRTSQKKLDSDEKYKKEHILNQIMDMDSASVQDLILKILQKQKSDRIPLSLFNNKVYTLNESIVKFLHENLGMSFKIIADLTAKSNKTVWQLYQNAQKKSKRPIKVIEDEFLGIPLEILHNSKLSTLEIVVKYLRDEIGMSWNIIADRLNRDYKTVWTTYRRAIKKYNG